MRVAPSKNQLDPISRFRTIHLKIQQKIVNFKPVWTSEGIIHFHIPKTWRAFQNVTIVHRRLDICTAGSFGFSYGNKVDNAVYISLNFRATLKYDWLYIVLKWSIPAFYEHPQQLLIGPYS